VGGERDALAYYSRPLTGVYYVAPSLDDLGGYAAGNAP
jgi:deferrochelatase/peroxidase EfeB